MHHKISQENPVASTSLFLACGCQACAARRETSQSERWAMGPCVVLFFRAASSASANAGKSQCAEFIRGFAKTQ